jgi:hypothetical protein
MLEEFTLVLPSTKETLKAAPYSTIPAKIVLPFPLERHLSIDAGIG